LNERSLIAFTSQPFHKYRAPEEYKVEALSEKVDVFSLGNIIYSIITGSFPFEGTFEGREFSSKEGRKRVKNGEKPPLKKEYRESDNPIDRVFLKAMELCFVYRWQDRAQAYEVRDLLLNGLRDAKAYYEREEP